MPIGALIPCRTGSKGIPNKNFKEFYGKPLWHWTLNVAIKSGIFDKIIVSSDGGLNGDSPVHIHVIEDNNRPSDLSGDNAPLDAVLNYYSLKNPDIELWCLLQPTSPLRTAKDIERAYKKINNEKYDSLVSVTPNPAMIWVDKAAGFKGTDYPLATYHIHKRPNRQDRKDWYMENGAIYFTKKYVLDQMGVRLGGKIVLYVMPQERSYEIDSPLDWLIAEHIMKMRTDGMRKEIKNVLAA